PFGVRREDLIVKDVPKNVIADGRTRYDTWLLARADARAAGSAPSLRVETVRERVEKLTENAAKPAAASPLTAELIQTAAFTLQPLDLRDPSTAERAAGASFGLRVHELLAQASFDASADDLDALARVQTRVLGLPDDDALAAAKAVRRVLQHALLK